MSAMEPQITSVLIVYYKYGARSESRFASLLLPLSRHVVPFNDDGNCRLTMPVVKEHLTPLMTACSNPLKKTLPQ